VLRRSFLKLAGWAAGIGVLAHHKPGHKGGPTPPTTTTLPPPVLDGIWSDIWLDLW
jgi:hypothetical protein